MTESPLARLRRLVAPPEAPSFCSGNWEAIERELGSRLPDDYKEMIEVFGDGVFRGSEFQSGIHITSYFRTVPARGFAESMSEYLRMLDVDFDTFPSSPGLLYIGEYKDVDILSWFTEGSPNDWSIVYVDVETGAHEIKGMGIVEFVISILEETSPLPPDVIKKGEMAGPHTFGP